MSGDAEARRARAVLVILNGGFEGMEYPLASDETIIGRNPTTEITLLDENISREHAVVFVDADQTCFTIEDLQSTNGTKVNGKRIRSADLSNGDEIEIGHTRFKFVLTD
jgi:pSer/pThr/pTyr-binding forkhead associated (FHA) protein